MIKKVSLVSVIISFLFCCCSIFAQEAGIYVPPQFQKIYNGDTRSWDGSPGDGYWQNSTDYYLKVWISPENNLVTGRGNLVYYNNSPDTLTKIVFRLYQDIFKRGIARDFGMNAEELTEGTTIEYLSINGNEIDPDTVGNRTYTNYHLRLNEPILPYSHADIEINWNFNFPENETLRMGKYREGGYFIAYWYPQIAVYDDVDGWDNTEYLGMVEFYNDINNFEVEITVPENYLVRATGDLVNAADILIDGIYSRYLKAQESENVVKIISSEDLTNDIITKEGNQTWKYIASGVPDFSFACVTDYLWDGVAALVDKETGRFVFTDVLYREDDNHFNQGAFFSKRIVEYLSTEMPGVPFPYSHMTSFCNGSRGGGMESPMMANDGAPKSKTRTFSLLHHEIAHTYFPFYMGINERKYGWMDEGWATFFPKDLVPEIDSNYNHYRGVFRRYSPLIGEESELPLMIPSKLIKGYPLVAAIYGRAFFAYSALQNLLGEEVFRKALKEFISRWSGKHPLPYDFFFTFNQVANEDLSWFWNPWFYNFGFCDLGIEQLENNEFAVKLIGNQPAPVEVQIDYEDGSKQMINESPSIWQHGRTEYILQLDVGKKVRSVKIIDDKIPDLNQDNNFLMIK